MFTWHPSSVINREEEMKDWKLDQTPVSFIPAFWRRPHYESMRTPHLLGGCWVCLVGVSPKCERKRQFLVFCFVVYVILCKKLTMWLGQDLTQPCIVPDPGCKPDELGMQRCGRWKPRAPVKRMLTNVPLLSVRTFIRRVSSTISIMSFVSW